MGRAVSCIVWCGVVRFGVVLCGSVVGGLSFGVACVLVRCDSAATGGRLDSRAVETVWPSCSKARVA